ncbi:MAG: hypothetical protein R2991_04545 [Thermoanaerobaculia bacterium]
MVEPGLFAGLGDADSPQGILAVAQRPERGVEAILATPPSSSTWTKRAGPGNLGALARCAEAAGADALRLAPAGTPTTPGLRGAPAVSCGSPWRAAWTPPGRRPPAEVAWSA